MKYGFAFDGEEENLLELAREAGVTWWIESRWQRKAEDLPRLKQGPPRLDISSA